MKLKFLADADLNQAVVEGVKRRVSAIDFKTATEGRALVSHDFRTMRYEFAEFVENEVSSGVILVSQKAGVGWAIDEPIHIWAETEAED